MRSLQLALCLCLAWIPASGTLATENPPAIPEEALRRLEYMQGRWKVQAESLAADGSVAGTMEWENRAEWLIEGSVVLLTHDIPSRNAISKAFVFYSHEDELFYIVDVNHKGELWILSGGLDHHVITSRPKKSKGGGDIILRFSHDEVSETKTRVLMEYSKDAGKTWVKGQRQTLTRVD